SPDRARVGRTGDPDGPIGLALPARREGEGAALGSRPLSLPGFLALAEQLVELDPEDEDEHGEVEVCAEDEERCQEADPGLEVRDVRDPDAEDEREDDPRADDRDRPAARPARPRVLGRPVADERADGEPEQRGCDEPAPRAEDE